MAAFHLAWPPSHVPGSPETAGVYVGHRAHHLGLAECRLLARREVSLGLCLLTRCLGREGNRAAQPGGFGSTHVVRMDDKRELTDWEWMGVGRTRK